MHRFCQYNDVGSKLRRPRVSRRTSDGGGSGGGGGRGGYCDGGGYCNKQCDGHCDGGGGGVVMMVDVMVMGVVGSKWWL